MSYLCIFKFIICAFGVIFKKSLLKSNVMKFYSRNFMVSAFVFSSLIHFELIFIERVRWASKFILWHVDMQFSQYHSLKGLLFPHWVVLAPLLKIIWPHTWGFISRFSILLCWSRCLSLCQYYTILPTNLLSEIRKCETFNFVFFKTVLVFQGPSRFHINFWIFFVLQKHCWDFDSACSELIDHFG